MVSVHHQKTLTILSNAAVCNHPTILRINTLYWYDFIEKQLPPTLNCEENVILGDTLEKDPNPNAKGVMLQVKTIAPSLRKSY